LEIRHILQHKISKDIPISLTLFVGYAPIIPLSDCCDCYDIMDFRMHAFYHTAISYPESVQFQDIHMRVIIYDYRENVSLAEEGASC